MPGGQFTNLLAQAKSLGLETKWPEIAKTYSDVNQIFGDIVKVTPSSKVVGDMALMMVAQGISKEQVEDPNTEIIFPESVIDMLKGNLGQPPGGFPINLIKKAIGNDSYIKERPGSKIRQHSLLDIRKKASLDLSINDIDDEDFCSYLMYPKVFQDYLTHHSKYGPVRCLPTNVFFYGMENSQEISVEIDPGKILEIRLQAVSEVNDEGDRKVFFELNGQPRIIRIPDHNSSTTKLKQKPKAETNNPKHLAAPMPGAIASIAVKEGDLVKKGDVLLTIEAMKMETVLNAENNFCIKKIYTTIGSQIDAKDLLIEFD
jgi:pyruvate carboxylase